MRNLGDVKLPQDMGRSNSQFVVFLVSQVLICNLPVMEQTVEIPVEINGKERVFAARIQAWQYGLRFWVDVDGVEILLERDDAGEYRAVLPEGTAGKAPEKEVIGAIIKVLESL